MAFFTTDPLITGTTMNFRVKSAGESPCCCVVICNLCLQPLDYMLAVFADRDSTNLTSAAVWLPIRPPLRVYHRNCHQVTVRMEFKAWSGQTDDTPQAGFDSVYHAVVIIVRSSELLSLVSNRSVSKPVTGLSSSSGTALCVAARILSSDVWCSLRSKSIRSYIIWSFRWFIVHRSHNMSRSIERQPELKLK